MQLDFFTSNYENTESKNNEIFLEFTRLTNTVDYLKEHRDYIEENKLGFGDRAFHYMWFLLINKLKENNKVVNALEIGVFKGQVISLWELIAQEENIHVKLNAITPLEGKPQTKNTFYKYFKYIVSKKYREDHKAGNFYEDLDYIDIIKKLFKRFNLNFSNVNLVKGFSTDKEVLEKFETIKVDLIYIDGDHSYQGALHDIVQYSNKLNKGGYLVVDDASYNIPGSVFWKGYQSVSDACESIDKNNFINVLNVGHNRVYQKI